MSTRTNHEIALTLRAPEMRESTSHLKPGQLRRVTTGWRNRASKVSVEADGLSDLRFDNLAYSSYLWAGLRLVGVNVHGSLLSYSSLSLSFPHAFASLLRTRSESNQSRDGAALRCGRDAGVRPCPFFPQICWKLGKVNVPGFPSPCSARLKAAKRPSRMSLIFSSTGQIVC